MPASTRDQLTARPSRPALRTLGAAALATALVFGGTAAAAQEAPCPAAAPPPPVDSSEVPPPGQPEPSPLPVPEQPVGGERLGECGSVLPAGVPAPPEEVTAASWVLADLDSGEVLAAHDPHARHRPASTIKVLTALLAVRELDLSRQVVATQEDANMEGSRVGLEPGVSYTVEDVLAGLLLQSGNDAAHLLGRLLGGPDVAAEKMTRLAQHLGARDTRVATPSGLDGPGMSTSAYDLALVYREAMEEPDFARIVGTERTEIPGPPDQPPLEVRSNNQVLLNYPGGIGGKTGFTNDARHTFIGAAEQGGRRLVTVLMHGEQTPVRLSTQGERLLDYGYGMSAAEPVGRLVTPTPSPTATDGRGPGEGDRAAAAPSAGDTASPGVQSWAWPVGLAAAVAAVIAAVLAVRHRRARRAHRE
ncbi:D-alanyl-D-alanine carboxypeptidase family protein [Bounagaea algeriensis]